MIALIFLLLAPLQYGAVTDTVLVGKYNRIRADMEQAMPDTCAYWAISDFDTSALTVVVSSLADTSRATMYVDYRGILQDGGGPFAPVAPEPEPLGDLIAWVLLAVPILVVLILVFFMLWDWRLNRSNKMDRIEGYFKRIDRASLEIDQAIRQLDEWNWRGVKGTFVTGQERSENQSQPPPEMVEIKPRNPGHAGDGPAGTGRVRRFATPQQLSEKQNELLYKYRKPCPKCGKLMAAEVFDHWQYIRHHCYRGCTDYTEELTDMPKFPAMRAK